MRNLAHKGVRRKIADESDTPRPQNVVGYCSNSGRDFNYTVLDNIQDKN